MRASREESDDYADVALTLRKLRAERDARVREQLRDSVIERCLPLAEHVARRFSDRGEAFDDLLQVARIGVIHAVDRFDEDRGENFLAFAVPTVMGEVRKHFRDSAWAMRVPRRLKEASLRIAAASDELAQHFGRSPRPSELAEHLDLPVSDIIEGLTARSAYRTTSIDAEPSGTEGTALRDTLAAEDHELARVEDYLTIQPAVEALDQRDRRILNLRFFHAMSQSEIAERIGISQMHVSRILSRTLASLRNEVSSSPDAEGGSKATDGAAG